ncbi:MAG: NAD-binding protein, partial [Alphaproteobacteria bacterium]
MSNYGEFAFVVLTLAGGDGMIDPQGLAFINAIVVLTMLATPFLALLGRKLGASLEHQRDSRDSGPDGGAERLSDHVVIGGYGRVGQLIARLLEENGVPYVAVDLNVARVEEGRRQGKPIHFGDISRGEMLALIGAKSANSFVITTDEPSKVELTVRAIRDGWPDALI